MVEGMPEGLKVIVGACVGVIEGERVGADETDGELVGTSVG